MMCGAKMKQIVAPTAIARIEIEEPLAQLREVLDDRHAALGFARAARHEAGSGLVGRARGGAEVGCRGRRDRGLVRGVPVATTPGGACASGWRRSGSSRREHRDGVATGRGVGWRCVGRRRRRGTAVEVGDRAADLAAAGAAGRGGTPGTPGPPGGRCRASCRDRRPAARSRGPRGSRRGRARACWDSFRRADPTSA